MGNLISTKTWLYQVNGQKKDPISTGNSSKNAENHMLR